jgi:hypothetical protein
MRRFKRVCADVDTDDMTLAAPGRELRGPRSSSRPGDPTVGDQP